MQSATLSSLSCEITWFAEIERKFVAEYRRAREQKCVNAQVKLVGEHSGLQLG